MPLPSTLTPIATNTLTAAAASITFSSIPSTYTDLVLVTNLSTDTSATWSVYIQFNGDTGTNYSVTDIVGNGSTAASYRSSNGNFIRILGRATGTANTFSNMSKTNIQNYANTTTYKTLLNRSDIASQATVATVGMWRNTAAITSMTITVEGGTMGTGSTFNLFGIKAA